MEITQDEINRAIILCGAPAVFRLTFEKGACLVAEFGDDKGKALCEVVANFLHEIGKIEVDWSKHTLISGSDLAKEVFRARHPALSEQALDTLSNNFAYSWR